MVLLQMRSSQHSVAMAVLTVAFDGFTTFPRSGIKPGVYAGLVGAMRLAPPSFALLSRPFTVVLALRRRRPVERVGGRFAGSCGAKCRFTERRGLAPTGL